MIEEPGARAVLAAKGYTGAQKAYVVGEFTPGDNEYVIVFTNSVGSFTIERAGKAEILVVGGGGAGGSGGGSGTSYRGAGGGAGGLVYKASYDLQVGTYTVNVGAGGIAQAQTPGGNGGDSKLIFGGETLIHAYGGGGGGSYYSGTGHDGGSGGGGSAEQYNVRDGGSQLAAALAAGNMGNKGGKGDKGSWAGVFGGGGGGGAAEAGKDDSNVNSDACYGGAGFACSILGPSVYFGGGGGGSCFKNTSAKGGAGGGGDGSTANAKSGADGYGGGGGGAGGLGGNGGCGTVIVRLSASVNDTYVSAAEGFSRFESVPNRETGENDNVFVWTDATADHTFTILQKALVQMLVVGGGGAGGNFTAQIGTTGGGAGGEVKDVLEWLEPGTYTVRVGAGGQAKGTSVTTTGYRPGSPSSVTGPDSSTILSARGGSAGGDHSTAGQAAEGQFGGGGGGTYSALNPKAKEGGVPSDGAGYKGGDAYADGEAGQADAVYRSGGGAGAGDAGMSASATSYGYGGDGVYSDILGLPMSDASAWYGGGGGGGAASGGNLNTKFAVAGGKGGGGTSCTSSNDPSGLDGYGGGGGGDGYTNPGNGTGKGSGGSGTVIVRIQNPNYLHAAISSGVPGKTTCDVTWKVVGVGSDPDNTVSVKVSYGLTEACADGEIDCGSGRVQGESDTASLTGLTQGSLYYAKVTIADANSSSSAMTTFKTLGSQVFAKPGGTGTGSSWDDAASLKAAIATACTYVSTHPEDAGYAVFLKAGVYEMSEDVSNRLISQPITLRGGFKGEAGTSQELAANPISTIDGMTQYQLFKVTAASGTITMERLNITRGLLRAIEKTGAGELVLKDCSFDQNGFRYATGSTAEAKQKDTTHEPGWSSGGALTRYGGAICATAGSLVVERCTFTGNRYHVDGSLNASEFYNSSGNMWINCTASGGAIYAADLSAVRISDTRFIKNGPVGGMEYYVHRHVTRGSVIHLKNSPAVITGCEFRGNTSPNHKDENNGDSGGAVYITGAAGATTVDHCVFVGNSASFSHDVEARRTGGLMIDASSGSVAVESCTFAFNGTYRGNGGNALMMLAGTATVRNSIFHGNMTYTGDASYPKDIKVNGGSLTVSYSMFDGIDTQHIGGAWSRGEGVVEGDPLLGTLSVRMQMAEAGLTLGGGTFYEVQWTVDPAEIDAHLRSSSGRYDGNAWVVDLGEDSPAIDSGTGEFANETEPNGGVRNLGAYGNTAEASRSKLVIPYPPHLSEVTTGWADEYTDPTFTFSLVNEDGKPDVYGANITICWSETAPANPADPKSYVSSRDIGSKMSGESITQNLGSYFQADKTVYYLVYAVNEDGTDGKSGTFSTAGRPVPAGGGASVIHVDPASGDDTRDGKFWNQTVKTLARAAEIANADPNRYQVWLKGNATVTSATKGAFTTPVQIYGGFAGTEISVEERSGSTTLTGSSSGLLTLDAAKGEFVLDGITFTGSTGSAVVKTGMSNLTIQKCTFNTNGGSPTAAFCGGALNMNGGYSGNLTVVDTTFSGNGYHGGNGYNFQVHGSALYLVNVGQAIVQNCVFSENGPSNGNEMFATRAGSRGSAIYAGNTKLAVSGTKFVGNRITAHDSAADSGFGTTSRSGGGTVYLVGNCGDSMFRNCVFVGNSSGGQGARTSGSGGVLIYQKADEICEFDNCTFAWNASYGSDGNSIYAGSGVVNVRNSIFYGSTRVDGGTMSASEVACDTGSVNLDYCLFESTSSKYSAGTGGSASNIVTGNPKFATETVSITKGSAVYSSNWFAPTYGTPGATSIDVHLRSKVGRWYDSAWVTDSADSPALDQGDPTADYSNEPDPNGGRLNLGVYGNTAEASKSQATVTVTLHGNGGTPETQTVQATPGAAMPTLAAGQIPTRTGYTFQGFSTESWEVSYMTGVAEQDVCNEGSTKFAKLVRSDGEPQTVNGVVFTADLADATARSNVMGLEGTWTKADKGSYEDEDQSDGFGQILKNGIFQDGLTTANVTLKGLTSGRLYLFQLFVHDGRGSYCNRTVSEDGENWMKYGNPSGAGGTGKYGVSLIRRFVATGTEETVRVYFNYSSPGGISAQINAAQLRDLGATSVLGKYYNDDGTSAKNYPVENGPTELFAQWTKAVQTVSRPTQTWTSSPYNGTVQMPSYPAADGYTVAYSDGDWKKVGSNYTVTFALKPNWQWASGADTSLPIVFNYEITKAEISAVTLTATSETYDGQPHQPTVASVTASGTEFNSTSAGTAGWAVTYSRGGSSTVDFTSVGTITVTVTGTKNLTGSASAVFEIEGHMVTLDKRGGVEGTDSVVATPGQAMPEIEPPFRNGYSFKGYFTQVEGGGVQYYNADGTSAQTYPASDGPTTLYANWEFVKTYYLMSSDATGGISSFDGTPSGNVGTDYGWRENNEAGAKSVRHTVEAGHDYVAGALLNMDGSKTEEQTFKGDKLTLSSWMYIYSDVTIPNLVSSDGTVCLNQDNATAKLSGNIQIQQNKLLTFVLCRANRRLEVNSKISGDSSTTLRVRGQNMSDNGLVYTFSGDASEFKGQFYHSSAGGDAFTSPFDILFTGSFGGRVKGLPTMATNVRFNYDGLPETRTTRGLAMSCASADDVQSVQTNITFYPSSANFSAAKFPLMTFPAGTTVNLSDFTVYHAATVDGEKTAFTNLGKIVNSDNTITLVANVQMIAKPSAVTGLIYNGNAQKGVLDGEGYTLTGDTGTDATSYTATATLKSGYVWSDGTTADVNITWSIAKASNAWTTMPKLSATSYPANRPAVLTWGVATFGTATATLDGDSFAQGSALPVTLGNHKLVFTVAETSNYAGLSETIDFTVTDALYDLHAISATGPVIKDVPSSWLAAAFTDVDPTQAAYQAEFLKVNASGVKAWQAYVLGFEGGQVATAKLVEETVQNADPATVTIRLANMPPLREGTGCTVKYSLYAATSTEDLMNDRGTVVTNDTDTTNVKVYDKWDKSTFEAPLDDLTENEPVRYYRIKVHFTFSGGGGGGGVTELFSYVGQVDRSNLPTGWTAGGATTANLKSGLIDVPESCKGNGYIRITFDSKVKYNHCRLEVAFCDANGATLTGIDVLKNIGDSLGAGRDTFEPTMVVYRVPAGADVSKIQLQWLNATDIGADQRQPSDIELKDIKVESVDYLTAATDIDTIFSASVNQNAYADAKDVHFDASKADWTRGLKGLHDALVEGGYYDILVMGDSLCEAPINGGLEALIKRQWPQSNVRVHVCWSNNTGCPQFLGTSTKYPSSEAEEYYSELNFSNYDCVIFSGTTQARYAGSLSILTDAITTINAKIKEQNPNCSVVFLAPQLSVDSRYFSPWGTADPANYWNTPNGFFVAYGNACAARTDFAVASDGWAAKDYNIMSGGLPTLTDSLGMAYWDLYEFAYDYLFRSGKPYFYYSRDAQHANEYNRVLSAKQLFEVFKLVAAKDFTTP